MSSNSDATTSRFFSHFDSVVMLTWSDWRTEMRGNRYHYATRFAKHLPVFFVQTDLNEPDCVVEASGEANITLVRVSKDTAYDQRDRELHATLHAAGCRRPLAWVYNPHFFSFIPRLGAPLAIFHATENYFVPEFFASGSTSQDIERVMLLSRSAVSACDGVVCVAEAVHQSFRASIPTPVPMTVVANGCDYTFFESISAGTQRPSDAPPVAIYQGNISHKLDFALLGQIADFLPGWCLQLAGRVSEDCADALSQLCARPNVEHLGTLTPAELAVTMKNATVGIIPFENKSVWTGSYPLKALEYVACGLPVVSTPVRSLLDHASVISFAEDAATFSRLIEESAALRHDADAARLRKEVAAANSYDSRFAQAVKWMTGLLEAPRLRPAAREPRALILYDHASTHVGNLREHLESFQTHARKLRYTYCTATWQDGEAHRDIVHAFDAVVIHHSVRVCFEGHLATGWTEELARYQGVKILFVQDEYDNIEITRSFIEQAEIDIVFTCVPDGERHKVYAPDRFSQVRFINCLTGYVGEHYAQLSRDFSLTPPSQRKTLFAYRGRRLPYFYGTLGEEKREIGDFMKRYCAERGLPADIETDDTRRIYGDDWWRFLGGARATLATESGANLFDQQGELREMLAGYLAGHPDASYLEVRQALHPHFEESVLMNQISPKVFEAIATRTALVMFEGRYSGVVEPLRHYIPLKKDFSNVDEVVSKVLDDELVDEMTRRAFDEIIAPGTWSAETFFRGIEQTILESIRHQKRRPLTFGDRPLAGSLASDVPLLRHEAELLAACEIPNAFLLSPQTRKHIDCLEAELRKRNDRIEHLKETVRKKEERVESYRRRYQETKHELLSLSGGGFFSRLARTFLRRGQKSRRSPQN